MDMLPAQLPYYIMTLAALLTSFGAGLAAATGARARWFWLHAAGVGIIGIGLALSVIITGPAPQLATAEVRIAIRWLFCIGGVPWLLWAALYNLHIVRIQPRAQKKAKGDGRGQ